MGGMQTKSRHAILEAYSTQSQEYYFYFPEVGEFPHYPVHVAQNEEVVAASEPFMFKVMAEVGIIHAIQVYIEFCVLEFNEPTLPVLFDGNFLTGFEIFTVEAQALICRGEEAAAGR